MVLIATMIVTTTVVRTVIMIMIVVIVAGIANSCSDCSYFVFLITFTLSLPSASCSF